MSNTEERAPINCYFTYQLIRIYENFKEKYFRSKVEVDCLKGSEFDSCDKKDIKEKENDLVRLH